MFNIFSVNVFVTSAVMLIVKELDFADCYYLLTHLLKGGIWRKVKNALTNNSSSHDPGVSHLKHF